MTKPIDTECANIKVKSVFDPTRSGTYMAILEVGKRRRFVKEGESFDGYEVLRIDGIRKCITMIRRDSQEEKEFCAVG